MASFGVQVKIFSRGGDIRSIGASASAVRALTAALVMSGLAAMPAHAGNFPELSPSLTYPVSGIVSPKCQLAVTNNSVSIDNLANPADDMTMATDVSLPFEVACNTPVRVAMQSRNGGLQSSGRGTSDPAFSDLITYQARVDLPGQQNVLSCTSERMADGRKECQREAEGVVGSGPGAIRVQINGGQGLLLAGRYSDVVTITIAPQMGGEDLGTTEG